MRWTLAQHILIFNHFQDGGIFFEYFPAGLEFGHVFSPSDVSARVMLVKFDSHVLTFLPETTLSLSCWSSLIPVYLLSYLKPLFLCHVGQV